jgi:hypothetical protein
VRERSGSTLNEALALIATHFYLAREVTVPSAGTSERPRARRCSRCATADAGDVPSSAVLATGRAVKVREVISLIEADGWALLAIGNTGTPPSPGG